MSEIPFNTKRKFAVCSLASFIRCSRKMILLTCLVTGTFAAANVSAEITQILDASGDGVNALQMPWGVEVDKDGNIYVAGFGSDNVFKVASDGTITEIIDSSGDGVNQLDEPYDLAVSDADVNSGSVFVAGYGSNNVFEIRSDTTKRQTIGPQGDGGVNVLEGPASIAVLSNGDHWVAGSTSNNVFRVFHTGTVIELLNESSGGGMLEPFSVLVDQNNFPFVSARGSNKVLKYVGPGVETIINSSGDGANPLQGPFDIGRHGSNIYVSSFQSNDVYRVTADGDVTRILDGSGDGTNPLISPRGLAVDNYGNVFVAGSGSNNVFVVTPAGTIVEVIDETGDGVHPLGSPLSVAITEGGAVVVSGSGSNNVFKISPNSYIPAIQDLEPSFNCVNDQNRSVLVGQSSEFFAYSDPDSDSGCVLMYRWFGGGRFLEQVLRLPDDRVGGQFGASIDILGDLLLIGAPGATEEQLNGETQAVQAILYLRINESWTKFIEFVSDDKTGQDGFGHQVALTGRRYGSTAFGPFGAYISAPYANENEGVVYGFSDLDNQPSEVTSSMANILIGPQYCDSSSAEEFGNHMESIIPEGEQEGEQVRHHLHVNWFRRTPVTDISNPDSSTDSRSGVAAEDVVTTAIEYLPIDVPAVGEPKIAGGRILAEFEGTERITTSGGHSRRRIRASGVSGVVDQEFTIAYTSGGVVHTVRWAPDDVPPPRSTVCGGQLQNPTMKVTDSNLNSAGQSQVTANEIIRGAITQAIPRESDRFGSSISVSDAGIAIGVPGINEGDGAVLLYDWQFNQIAEIVPQSDDHSFGKSVSLGRGGLIIGSTENGSGNGSAVYLRANKVFNSGFE